MSKMKRSIASLSTAILVAPALADVNYIWANKGSDMLEASNYYLSDGETVSSAIPTASDRIFFAGTPTVQPYLSSSLEVRAISFGPIGNNGQTGAPSDNTATNAYDNCGWEITGAAGAELVFPQSWNNMNNWNFAISQGTYGTNVVNVPVRFTGTGTGNNALRPIQPSGGRLVFAKPVSSDNDEAEIVFSGWYGGCVELAAANPGLKCILRQQSWTEVSISHPEAIVNVPTFRVTGDTYPERVYYLHNETGAPLVLPNLKWFGQYQQKTTHYHFDGDPFLCSNAVFYILGNQDKRRFYFDTHCTFKGIENANAGAGFAQPFEKRGAGTLEILEDIFTTAPKTQTNHVDVIHGALLLRNPAQLKRQTTLFGEGGYFWENGSRPAMGLVQDWDMALGDGPDGVATYSDRSYVMGWAAFGGDRRVTMFGEDLLLMNNGEGLTVRGSNAWRQRPCRLVFGAPDADGTVIFDQGIDIYRDNNGDARATAIQGEEFVAGRIKGTVSNATKSNGNTTMTKDGNGVLALDGDYLMTRTSSVYAGGLLVNATCANQWNVSSGAWIGGTGTTKALSIAAGGGIRGGEQGGELTVSGNVTMADGAKLIVDIGPKAGDSELHGCTVLKGSKQSCKAEGTITVVPVLFGDVTGGRRVKILDWNGADSPTDSSMFSLDNYVLDADEEVYSRAELSVSGNAMYLTFAVRNNHPTLIFIR